MRFKDQQVWVLADEGGRLVLDADGRAEMKYRETDAKSYRPSPSNLLREGTTMPSAMMPSATVPAAARAAPVRPSAARSPAKRRPAGAAVHEPAIEIWTDGACSGNPGPMGIGVVVIEGSVRKELGEYLGIGTNNIAELTAIERGLDVATEVSKGDLSRRMRVYTDSMYSIGVLDKGWKAKANQELIGRLRRRVQALSALEFVKVSGHAGVPENERCDELARAAVTRRVAVI